MIDRVARAIVTATGAGPGGAPRQQIWVTEMGWSSQNADPSTIAAGLQDFFAALQDGARARDNIGPVLWYDLRDNATLSTRDDQLGLRLTAADGADAGPTPAWSVFSRAALGEGALQLPAVLVDSGPHIARVASTTHARQQRRVRCARSARGVCRPKPKRTGS